MGWCISDYLLKNCVITMIYRPEYIKGSIYDLRKAAMEISNLSMLWFSRYLKLFCVSKITEIEIAIIVSSEYQKSIVEIFIGKEK